VETRIECRGDYWHFHFIGEDCRETEVIFTWEALRDSQALLNSAIGAWLDEADRIKKGGKPVFERIARLEPVDSLASH
jgi:hypothetical protein